MSVVDPQSRQAAADAFNERTGRRDGAAVAVFLHDGLTQLHSLFLSRVDPTSFGPTAQQAHAAVFQEASFDVCLFSAVESAVQVRYHHYLQLRDDWYAKWLALLLVDSHAALRKLVAGIDQYEKQAADGRQKSLRVAIERRVPAALHAPPLAWRILPLGVAVVTALAFGDRAGADDARRLQATLLSQVTSCKTCQGQILPLGKFCQTCGNPFWRREWLSGD